LNKEETWTISYINDLCPVPQALLTTNTGNRGWAGGIKAGRSAAFTFGIVVALRNQPSILTSKPSISDYPESREKLLIYI
jgi:hypothetical protein